MVMMVLLLVLLMRRQMLLLLLIPGLLLVRRLALLLLLLLRVGVLLQEVWLRALNSGGREGWSDVKRRSEVGQGRFGNATYGGEMHERCVRWGPAM